MLNDLFKSPAGTSNPDNTSIFSVSNNLKAEAGDDALNHKGKN
jgi:hypothetical protein